MIWINDDEVLNCIITCTSLHCKSTTVDTSWQLNMAKHEVNTTRNAPMCLKRSPSTNELVSTVLSQLIYLFLNVRGKWNVQPSFVQKKYHTYLKHDGLWGCFSFRYFTIYEVKRFILWYTHVQQSERKLKKLYILIYHSQEYEIWNV